MPQVVAHHRQPGAVSAAAADPECERIAAAPPANDRNGMYTGPTIEPAGGQEPAKCCRKPAFRQADYQRYDRLKPATRAQGIEVPTGP